MTPAARLSAAIEVLDRYFDGMPLEKALTNWARRSRFAGSKDRAAIRDIVFDCVRNKNSFAAKAGSVTGRGLVLAWAWQAFGPEQAQSLCDGQGHAPAPHTPTELLQLNESGDTPADAESYDLPDWLIEPFREAFGPDAQSVAQTMRSRAPVFLRVNLRKTDRKSAVDLLAQDGIKTRALSNVSTALEVIENPRRVAASNAYKKGLVELQDAAPQAACLALPAAEKFLDYCAGGGGKTLAYGALHEAELYAYDANPERFKDLPDRASRASLDVKVLTAKKTSSHAPFDLVVADVPCSGSGTWRRAPEGKWALSPARLAELQRTQSEILDAASDLIGAAGCLAYMTCSVLKSENEDQVRAFLTRHSEFECLSKARFIPGPYGDGFYFAHLTKRQERT